MWKRGVVMALFSAALVLGCTESADDQEEPSRGGDVDGSVPAASQAITELPDDDVVVVSATAAADRAIGTSEVLFRDSPVVLVAAEDDLASQTVAAPLAVGLGVPLLLTPGVSEGADGDVADGDVAAEVGRLDPEVVVAFGERVAEQAEQWDVTVTRAPSNSADLVGWTSREAFEWGDPAEVADAELVAAVASLTPDAPTSLRLAGAGQESAEESSDEESNDEPSNGERPDGGEDDSRLPRVAPAAPLDTLTVFTEPGVENVAAAATARASGARVLVADDADPRADPELIAALADEPPEHVLGLGGDIAPADTLRNRLAVAATGVQLPGGGQTLFPGRRFIALYGTPRSSAMGSLGEQPMDETIERAQETAAEYEQTVEEPIVPALEIITTIAQTEPGPQGDYSSRTPVEELRPWIDAAADAGMYVVLDLQPGHADFLSQAKEYEELLLEPHVGLALDPEWRLSDGQRHLEQIGRVDAAEINEVAEWLANLTATHQLPQKLLVLHQFTLDMISDRADVETGYDELAVLIHADGFGTPQLKLETWNRLRSGAPDGIWWGWKNFIDEDQPTFTPAETMELEPAPWFVSYQ